MLCKLYNLSSKDSQLPYEIDGIINDKSKPLKWNFIGEVDDLDVARNMMLHDKGIFEKNGKVYILKNEPCNDMLFDFGKIVYGENIEYYDKYCSDGLTIFGIRRMTEEI